jgi:Xaa-Pro aminopeptidase
VDTSHGGSAREPPLVPPDVLAPGVVTTIEPGIYIPRYGGVRIDDTVIVAERGNRTLSALTTDRIEVD